ncbi:hypothetical protein PINS_up002917 [Pythium insidiosum]|nr:hypothetical protein PINS_up002917 [Pythium insidiosum]
MVTQTEELLERVVDRKVIDGTVSYRVEWSEFTGDDRYSWEPVENLVGHEDWMELVDLWKEKFESTMTFSAFLKNNRRGYRVGAGEEMRCFFFAIEAARRLLKLSAFDVDAVIQWLEGKGWDFRGGVKRDSLQPLMEAMAKSGLEIDYQIWRVNLHKTEMGTGHTGIEEALDPGAGVYMIGTQDPRGIGHCWVLGIDEDEMMTAYDNGSEVSFSEIRLQKILWVRRCVKFLKKSRNRSKRKHSESSGRSANQVQQQEESQKPKRKRRRHPHLGRKNVK